MNYENSFKYYCYLQRLKVSSYYKDDLINLYESKQFEFNQNVDKFTLHEYSKLYDRLRGRKRTLREKLIRMFALYGEPRFFTLTFKDKYLKNSKATSRKQEIKEFLNTYCNEYIANIDFGKKNGREHYHAIVDSKISDDGLKYYRKRFGSINSIPIYSKNVVKLSKYLDKLVNHSFKDTTVNKCIYSRTRAKK